MLSRFSNLRCSMTSGPDDMLSVSLGFSRLVCLRVCLSIRLFIIMFVCFICQAKVESKKPLKLSAQILALLNEHFANTL